MPIPSTATSKIAATVDAIPSQRRGDDRTAAAGPATRELARLLALVAQEPGALYSLASPIPHEAVLLVYHLPDDQTGTQGDHVDTHYLRSAVHAGLVELSEPTARFVPNGDIHQLQAVSLTDTGCQWLAAHLHEELTAELRRPDGRERYSSYHGWESASWSGSTRSR